MTLPSLSWQIALVAQRMTTRRCPVAFIDTSNVFHNGADIIPFTYQHHRSLSNDMIKPNEIMSDIWEYCLHPRNNCMWIAFYEGRHSLSSLAPIERFAAAEVLHHRNVSSRGYASKNAERNIKNEKVDDASFSLLTKRTKQANGGLWTIDCPSCNEAADLAMIGLLAQYHNVVKKKEKQRGDPFKLASGKGNHKKKLKKRKKAKTCAMEPFEDESHCIDTILTNSMESIPHHSVDAIATKNICINEKESNFSEGKRKQKQRSLFIVSDDIKLWDSVTMLFGEERGEGERLWDVHRVQGELFRKQFFADNYFCSL